ncbi:hypothetical protein JCM3770_003211 [Rhodotorula araucariae]
MPPRHQRLRATASSGSDSRSDGESGDDSDASRDHASSSSSAGERQSDDDSGDEERGASRRGRKDRSARQGRRRNALLVTGLIVLLLVAIGAAVWFYVRQSAGLVSPTGVLAGAGGTKATAGEPGSTGGGTVGAGGAGSGGSSKVVAVSGGSTFSSQASAKDGAGGDKSTRKPTASASLGDSQPSSAASASSSKSNSSTSGCKKGVGFNDAKYTVKLDICWGYNWASTGGEGIREGAMYVPMLRSWGAETDGWMDNANKAIKAGATHVLGFNEPDHPKQANLSPKDAAQLWLDQIEPLAGSAKLVSPGVTNGVKLDNGSAMGVPWLQEFLEACSKCTIDAVALHWYTDAGNTAYFTRYMEESHAALNKPIWLTEFMGTGTPDKQKDFVNFAVPWLEQQDWIERYAGFGAFLDNEIASFIASDDGKLNDLGKAYSNAK